MSDPDLTPAQDDAVRALLAGARHTDPAPPEVVARLDAELASLTADRRGDQHHRPVAPVVTLASRRRRRAVTAVLAAACVVVVGVGVTQVLPSGTSSDDSSAGSAADSSALSEQDLGADRPVPESGGALESQPADPGEKQELDSTQVPRATAELPEGPPFALTTAAALAPQVRALRVRALTSSYAAPDDCLSTDAEGGADLASAPQVRVTLDDEPGVLVFGEATAGTQRVDLFVCGASRPVRSVTLGPR